MSAPSPPQGSAANSYRITKRERSSHIHQCSRKVEAKRLGQLSSRMEYCYFCNRWFAQGEDWDSHCRQKHLSPPPTDCGVLTRCNTMIKPSFCPLCLGQPGLAPSIRMKSWLRNADALDHIFKSHFTEPFHCTLCKETLGTRDAVEHHLADRHNLSGRNGNRSSPAGELKEYLEVEDSPSACPSSAVLVLDSPAESLPDPRPEPHAKPQSDGSHFQLRAPGPLARTYRDRKGRKGGLSFNVCAVCDFNGRFGYMLAGYFDSRPDSILARLAV